MSKDTTITEIVLDFHNVKTQSYRTFYCDGVFGALTPSGKVYLDLYLERLPIPKSVKMKLTEGENGSTETQELSRAGKEGVIREMECGLIFDIPTALKIRDFLDQKIKEFQDRAENL